MNPSREHVERYRLVARSCCRAGALICALQFIDLGVWELTVAFSSLSPLRFSQFWLYLKSFSLLPALSWLVFAMMLWRFDHRLARWIVPDPPTLGKHACPKCGYSLKGLGDRPICPECGADVRPPEAHGT